MYFASGWPKRYRHSHDDGPLLALQHNVTRTHFVVLSPHCLSLWSGGQVRAARFDLICLYSRILQHKRLNGSEIKERAI
jgi:hypothetical protein